MQQDDGGGWKLGNGNMNDRQREGVSKKPEKQQAGAGRNQEVLE